MSQLRFVKLSVVLRRPAYTVKFLLLLLRKHNSSFAVFGFRFRGGKQLLSVSQSLFCGLYYQLVHWCAWCTC